MLKGFNIPDDVNAPTSPVGHRDTSTLRVNGEETFRFFETCMPDRLLIQELRRDRHSVSHYVTVRVIMDLFMITSQGYSGLK